MEKISTKIDELADLDGSGFYELAKVSGITPAEWQVALAHMHLMGDLSEKEQNHARVLLEQHFAAVLKQLNIDLNVEGMDEGQVENALRGLIWNVPIHNAAESIKAIFCGHLL